MARAGLTHGTSPEELAFRGHHTNSGRVADARPGMEGGVGGATRADADAPIELGRCRAGRTKLRRSSASSASRIGRRRILAGSSVAMPANWAANGLSTVLRIDSGFVLGEMLAISIGSLRFSSAAGYLALVPVYVSHCPIPHVISASFGSGGGCARIRRTRAIGARPSGVGSPIGQLDRSPRGIYVSAHALLRRSFRRSFDLARAGSGTRRTRPQSYGGWTRGNGVSRPLSSHVDLAADVKAACCFSSNSPH